MSATSYLLPCSCGRSVPIEIGQAGDLIPCACGLKLEVPAMREIRKLQTVDAAPAAEKPEWDARRGVMFVGGLLAIVGVVAIAIITMRLPKRPTFDVPALVQVEQAKIDKMSVSDSWIFWLRDVEGPGLMKFPNPQDDHFEAKQQSSFFVRMFFGGLAVFGAVIAVGALFWKPPARKRA